MREEEAFVRETLETGDMRDIRAAYQSGDDSTAFWVAIEVPVVDAVKVATNTHGPGKPPRRVVGMVGLRRGAVEGVADVGRLTVSSTCRGRGVATMLLTTLVERAWATGYTKVTATTRYCNHPSPL